MSESKNLELLFDPVYHKTSVASDISFRSGNLTKRDILSLLLKSEMDFHNEKSLYATHDLHAFAAKFPPQLPRVFIRNLTDPGDVVLDPMVGSGTTIVEASLENRKGIGIDIDPLAILICQIKITPLDTDILGKTGLEVLRDARDYLDSEEKIEHELKQRFDNKTKSFIDYWYFPKTQRELMALILAIEDVKDKDTYNFLKLTLSSIIVTKSGGVTRARDLAHTRPHLDSNKIPKNALDQFALRINKNINSVSRMKTNGISTPITGDARLLPIADEKIDLIVTSPPYANAIDYMRAHKFSLVWFGAVLDELSNLRSKYLGAEKKEKIDSNQLPENAQSILKFLFITDPYKAAILAKYYNEMKMTITEMYRVLKKNCSAVMVIGTSTMRGLDVKTHLCLADIAEQVGFDIVGIKERFLDRNRRMLPVHKNIQPLSSIENRIHREYVIGLHK